MGTRDSTEGDRNPPHSHLTLTKTSKTARVANAPNQHVLIAEDDRAVREALVRALELEGYCVTATTNGAECLDAVRTSEPDILLLDVSMPMVDGLTVCRVVPILMLTARTETSDRVAGLDVGADDYLPKPYDLDELLARLRALVRRADYSTAETAAPLTLGDLRLDPAARRVFRGDRELVMSKTEFDLLELLVQNQGIVLDHTTIYERIWHYDFGPDSKNLAVYIGYLRRKTEERDEQRLVHTVRGVGYTARLSGAS